MHMMMSGGKKMQVASITDQRVSLTRVEYKGLHGEVSLADGHAFHDLHLDLADVVVNLGSIWKSATARRIPELEAEFGTTFGDAAKSPVLRSYRHYRICPTASNSIDIAAAWLKATERRVLLIEPTFDNLALILRRRGVPLYRLQDRNLYNSLREGTFASLLANSGVDALFLVNPNNPTGITLGQDDLTTIFGECARQQIIVVMDNTFRFFVRNPVDDYELLVESGATFISIEDTGKTWPTQDMKVSMLCFSRNLMAEMNELYEEIFLCASPFTLSFMSTLIAKTTAIGLEKVLWNLVDRRRSALRAAIAESMLEVDPVAVDSKLSVEWLRCRDTRLVDSDIVERLGASGVTILPGRPFFWASRYDAANHHNVRVSLLRPEPYFQTAVTRLEDAARRLSTAD
jgi:aspartate/methionine/tyrosine aminotransferase